MDQVKHDNRLIAGWPAPGRRRAAGCGQGVQREDRRTV